MIYLKKAADWLQESVDRRQLLRFCLVAGLLIGLLGHAFMFANKIPNFDDLEYYADLDIAGLGAGRYVLHFLWKCFSDLSTPWFNGIVGVLALCMAAFFLCEAFRLNRNWQVLAMTVVLQLYPVNISTYCFMYEAHIFMIGVMLSCMAAWLLRNHRSLLRYALAALLIMLATGIYQVYVMLAIGLMILLVIFKTIQSARTGNSAADVWRFALGCAAAGVAGLALYLVGMKLVNAIFGTVLNSYQGMNTIGSINVKLIPQKLMDSYADVWNMYVKRPPDYVNGRMRLMQTALLVLGVAGLVIQTLRCVLAKKPMHALLMAACALLLPQACCGIYFMGDTINAHSNTLYPMILMLFLPVVVIGPELLPARWNLRRVAALGMTLLYLGYGFTCVILSNQGYYRQHMSFTRAEHFANRLAMRIEEVEGYHPMAPLKIWGHLSHEEEKSLMYFEYDIASRFLPFFGINMELDFSWSYCMVNLLSRVIGLPVSDAVAWMPQTQEEQAALDAMPCYPQQGSIGWVGDVLVVKLSHDPE